MAKRKKNLPRDTARTSFSVVCSGTYPGVNEWWLNSVGHKMSFARAYKRKYQNMIIHELTEFRKIRMYGAVQVTFKYYAPDTKRDKDNVSGFFRKIFLDAMVQVGIIANDTWRDIAGYTELFYIDSVHPRIEVEVREV